MRRAARVMWIVARPQNRTTIHDIYAQYKNYGARTCTGKYCDHEEECNAGEIPHKLPTSINGCANISNLYMHPTEGVDTIHETCDLSYTLNRSCYRIPHLMSHNSDNFFFYYILISKPKQRFLQL